jgi:hypothetical protein
LSRGRAVINNLDVGSPANGGQDGGSWMEQRDRLIADTLAFVKEISAERPELAARLQQSARAEHTNPAPLIPDRPPVIPDRPSFIAERLKPLEVVDMREDIRARVAAFRATQKAMQDQREIYFKDTLAKARATFKQPADPSSGPDR